MIATAVLPHTISVEAFGGDTATGPVYGPATVYPARVSGTRRVVRTSTGEEQNAVAEVVVRPDADVPLRSRVEWDGRSYVVLASADRMQLRRAVFTELQLGWAD